MILLVDKLLVGSKLVLPFMTGMDSFTLPHGVPGLFYSIYITPGRLKKILDLQLEMPSDSI